MDKLAGKFGAGLIWVFALGSVGLGVFANLAAEKLGLAELAGLDLCVYGALAFFGSFFTRAKSSTGILAFVLAGVVSAALYFTIHYLTVSGFFSEAMTAGGASAEKEAGAKVVGSAMGFFAGFFVGMVVLVGSLGGGITGCIVGDKVKVRMQAKRAA